MTLVERGYFCREFLADVVDGATEGVDLLAYRNLRLAEPTFLEATRRAAARGVMVRVLALDSAAPDQIVAQATQVIPRPRVDPGTLRRQLADGEERIAQAVAGWNPELRVWFGYRGYDIVPGPHLARTDATIRMGFVGTLPEAQPGLLMDRPYVEIPVASAAGRVMGDHFDLLWERSRTLV